MKYIIYVFITITLLISSISCTTVSESGENGVSLIIPLYSFPTDQNGEIWNSVFRASESVPIAVIWGLVDTANEPVYQQYVSHLHTSENISLYAYVATGSGQIPSEEVKEEIDYYVNHFDIDGIFFDEVSNESQYIAYYRDLVLYAKKYPEIRKVILNSSYAPPDFLERTGADILIIFENYGSEWNDFSKEDYISLPANRKAVIVHSVSSVSQMKEIISDAVMNKIGYVYVTDRGYDELPSYWNEEVNYIEEIRR